MKDLSDCTSQGYGGETEVATCNVKSCPGDTLVPGRIIITQGIDMETAMERLPTMKEIIKRSAFLDETYGTEIIMFEEIAPWGEVRRSLSESLWGMITRRKLQTVTTNIIHKSHDFY